MADLAKFFKLSNEVIAAQRKGQALVALESAVITHGLPSPQNLSLAQKLQEIVRQEGAVPATIGLLEGRVLIGMEDDELEKLAKSDSPLKLSSRDLAAAISGNHNGGTTVAGTLRVAKQAGIRVHATGGIGGVHRGGTWDVSADLAEIARQEILVVCAGAKSILDLPATLEQLESLGVPVVGYQTDEFPAFYSQDSGLMLNTRANNPRDAAEMASNHWQLEGRGVLLAVPPPESSALAYKEVEVWIESAQKEAEKAGVRGQALTPYLLKRVSELSKGKTLDTNLDLLKNNARLAARVAMHLQPKTMLPGLLPKKA